MKRTALALIIIPILIFTLTNNAFSSDITIVSCDVISVEASSKTPPDRTGFRIVVFSFGSSDYKPFTIKENVERSCVEVLARLVNNKNFKIKGVSSTNSGRVYTLLWKE